MNEETEPDENQTPSYKYGVIDKRALIMRLEIVIQTVVLFVEIGFIHFGHFKLSGFLN